MRLRAGLRRIAVASSGVADRDAVLAARQGQAVHPLKCVGDVIQRRGAAEADIDVLAAQTDQWDGVVGGIVAQILQPDFFPVVGGAKGRLITLKEPQAVEPPARLINGTRADNMHPSYPNEPAVLFHIVVGASDD